MLLAVAARDRPVVRDRGEHSARDGLRLSGLDGAAIFLGKAAAIAVELLALEVVLGVGVFVLYDVTVHGSGSCS